MSTLPGRAPDSEIADSPSLPPDVEPYASLVELSPDAIVLHCQGQVVFVNQAGLDLVGAADPGEVVGQPVLRFVHPDDQALLQQRLQCLLLGQPVPPVELRFVTVDGRVVVGETRAVPFDYRGQPAALAVIRDLTERKRAEERLRFLAKASDVLTSSLDYETTLANVARLAVPHVADWCAVDILDEDGQIRRLITMHTDPAKQQLAEEYERQYPAAANPEYGVVQVLRSGQPQVAPEISDEMLEAAIDDPKRLAMIRSLGVHASMIVPLIARGRTLGAITLVSAESGRTFGAEDLHLAEDLARSMAAAIDNARLYQEAQEALRLREEFVSIAAHELKTPLTALQLQVQMLQRYVAQRPLSPERLARLVNRSERQVARFSRLIGDLLDVSRITAGRLELSCEKVDLTQLVREAVERFQEQADERAQIRLHAEDAVVGCWDASRIDQVITNVLSNAVKYGRGKPIDVTVQAADHVARLEVRDRGIGLAPQHHARIFERFERNVSDEHYAGLGLGLYITRQIVEAHAGRIEVESEPGRGATFTVTLPLERPTA